MSHLVKCPHCTSEFPIDQVMSAQVAATIRAELEAEFSQKTKSLVAQRNELNELRQALEARQATFDQQLGAAVAQERKKIESEARVVAQQAVALEIKDRDHQLQQAKKRLQSFEANELELRQKARALEEQAGKRELEIARRLDEERKKIRASAVEEVQEEAKLQQAETRLVVESLRKQIDDLKRKAEQGSQQMQGEVQEVELENLLAAEFPGDVIEPVAKGVCGGDVVQHVFDSTGRDCGVILWESKRTKNWSDKWLGKVIDDQQHAKASCACIVTSAMPDAVQHFGDINGVWVASWQCVRSAAIALRAVMIEAARARVAAQGQHTKAELVYQYVFGVEFRNRIRGLVEPYIEMQADLESEKRAFNRHWNKRQKQLDRALSSTTGLFGDLQGILGSGLQEIEGMDVLAIDIAKNSNDESSDSPSAQQDRRTRVD